MLLKGLWLFVRSTAPIRYKIRYKAEAKNVQSHHPYLFRPGRFFQFRYVIPELIRKYVRQREIKRTLRTEDLRTAVSMADCLLKWVEPSVQILVLNARVQRYPAMDRDIAIRKFAADFLSAGLKANEDSRIFLMDTLTPAFQTRRMALLDAKLRQIQDQLARNDYVEIDAILRRDYSQEDLAPYPADSDERIQLLRECMKAYVAFLKIELQRTKGDYDNPYDSATADLITAARRRPGTETAEKPSAGIAPPVPATSPTPVTIQLTQAIRNYTDEQMTAGNWGSRTTRMEYEVALNLLLDQFGDVDLATFTHQNLLDFRNKVLCRLPANREKKAAYRGLSVAELLKSEIPDQDRMSIVTVNKYIRRIGGLFNWAGRHSYLQKNPAEGLQYKKLKAAHEERAVYSPADLERMFVAIAKLPKRCKAWQYWTPLIALYSGMRQNEIAQLEWLNIVERDGIACFDINKHDGKKVKTSASIRLVPVHPALISLGFLDYVAQTRAEEGNELLWPDLPYRRDGYGQSISRWYAKWRKSWLQDSDERKDFHSYRHTFGNTLKQTGLLDIPLMELMGHSLEKSQTFGRYGKPLNVPALAEAIKKLDYKLDLDSIRRDWKD